MAGSIADEDEEVLDISEQTRRPLDGALKQQRIRAWSPYLDPWIVIGALFAIAAITIPVGYYIQALSNGVVELKIQYDKFDDPNALCHIDTPNANRTCQLSFTAPKDMNPPILVHYELTNFNQNHRKYMSSRDNYQLLGALTQDRTSSEDCDPLNYLGNIKLNPCGLIANTLFNDVFTLTSGVSSDTGRPLLMQETGIAWASDVEYMFAQPEGFNVRECPDDTCDDTCCEGDEWSCTSPYRDPKDGKCYSYFYPDDNTTQYLYETYPMVVSPLEGVKNEHFIVWMRVATMPTFRKFYGYLEQPIAAGTTFNFEVQANYDVNRFEGTKSLIVSTNTMFGGKNSYFGPIFYWSGYVCLIVGCFFVWKQGFRPRKIGDESYLHFKQE